MKALAISLSLMFFGSPQPFCQEKRPMTPEDIYNWIVVTDPVFSPLGDRVAFVTTQANKERNEYEGDIFTVSLEGNELVRLTTHPALDFNPQWSPDGLKIAFISLRNGKPQIYLIDINGGEATQITSMQHGVSSLEWSPDGKRLYFTAPTGADNCKQETGSELGLNKSVETKEKPRRITDFIYRTGTSYLDGSRQHLFFIDLEGESKPERLTSGEFDVGDFSVSPDGRYLAFGFVNARGGQKHGSLALLNVEDKSANTILNGIDCAWLSWSPDSGRIAFAGSIGFYGESALYSIKTDGTEFSNLTAELDRTPSNVQWSADGAEIYFLAGDKGNISLWKVSASGGQAKRIIGGERQLGSNSYYNDGPHLFAVSPDEKWVVTTLTDSVKPRELYKFDLNNGREEKITSFNDNLLSSLYLSEAEHFTTDRDGTTLDCWILKPVGYDEGKKYPAVLEIHGGPMIMWGNSFVGEFQILAGRGYAVIYTNPRGSGGYGTEFMNYVIDSWGEIPGGDILGALDKAISLFSFIDEGRQVVTGGSYGGYMTAWLIGHTDRFKAAVACRGVYNMMSFCTTSDYPFYFDELFGGWPWSERLDWMLENSPIMYVEEVKTPTLVLHSELDFRAPISNAEEYYMALKIAGAPAEFLRIPYEGHELSRSGEPELRVFRLEAIVDWFDRWIDK